MIEILSLHRTVREVEAKRLADERFSGLFHDELRISEYRHIVEVERLRVDERMTLCSARRLTKGRPRRKQQTDESDDRDARVDQHEPLRQRQRFPVVVEVHEDTPDRGNDEQTRRCECERGQPYSARAVDQQR